MSGWACGTGNAASRTIGALVAGEENGGSFLDKLSGVNKAGHRNLDVVEALHNNDPDCQHDNVLQCVWSPSSSERRPVQHCVEHGQAPNVT